MLSPVRYIMIWRFFEPLLWWRKVTNWRKTWNGEVFCCSAIADKLRFWANKTSRLVHNEHVRPCSTKQSEVRNKTFFFVSKSPSRHSSYVCLDLFWSSHWTPTRLASLCHQSLEELNCFANVSLKPDGSYPNKKFEDEPPIRLRRHAWCHPTGNLRN